MLLKGFKSMLPITAGVIPFGLVMGTVASHANLSALQTMGMNTFVFAGASQLAAIDLMLQKTSSVVVIATGLIINFRFMLYSAAFSPIVQKSHILIKLFSAYCLTDQTYTVLKANEDRLKTIKDHISFYFGASICMIVAWQSSVFLGYQFGNITPKSLSLEYAVPLSFVALVIPTLKNKNYLYVGISAAILSVLLKPLPYNLGLLTSGLLSIGLGAFLTRKKTHAN